MCLTRVLSSGQGDGPSAGRGFLNSARNDTRPGRRLPTLALLAVVHVATADVTFERAWRWYGNCIGFTVEQTADGGYVVGADVALDASDYRICLLKTDSLGDTLWTKAFGGRKFPDSVQGYQGAAGGTMRGGGYAILGTALRQETWFDVVVFGVSRNGDSLWNYQHVGPDGDALARLVGTLDGGVLAIGDLSGLPVSNMTFLKLDSAGSLQWQKVVNVDPPSCGWQVVQTRDSGFAGVGTVRTGHEWVLHLVKLNAAGDSQWVRSYGDPVSYLAYSLCQTHDDGYVLAGPAPPGVGCIMRTDKNGDSLWTRRYRFDWYDTTERRVRVDGFYSDARAVAETHDHGFIIAGHLLPFSGGFPRFLLLIRTDSLGETLWTRRFLPPLASSAFAWDVKQTSDGGFVITGDADARYIYLIKTDSLGRVESGLEASSGAPLPDRPVSAKPNPFLGTTRISYSVPVPGRVLVQVFDVAGRSVATLADGTVTAGRHETTWNPRGLAGGVYLVKLTQPDGTATEKLLLAR